MLDVVIAKGKDGSAASAKMALPLLSSPITPIMRAFRMHTIETVLMHQRPTWDKLVHVRVKDCVPAVIVCHYAVPAVVAVGVGSAHLEKIERSDEEVFYRRFGGVLCIVAVMSVLLMAFALRSTGLRRVDSSVCGN